MFTPRYALAGSLVVLGSLAMGCSDSDSTDDTDAGTDPVDTGAPDSGGDLDSGGGEGDAGDGLLDPSFDEDAGPPAEIPAMDSEQCVDALGMGFTPPDEAMCWSQAEPLADDNCGGFYCNWSEDQLLCQQPEQRPCASENEMELSCDMTLQNTVADCARETAAAILSGEITRDDFEDFSLKCAWDEIEEPISRACLTCYVDTASCAFDECRTACLAGDSMGCDTCREEAGCTPGFFQCTGSPDPQQINPDGSER